MESLYQLCSQYSPPPSLSHYYTYNSMNNSHYAYGRYKLIAWLYLPGTLSSIYPKWCSFLFSPYLPLKKIRQSFSAENHLQVTSENTFMNQHWLGLPSSFKGMCALPLPVHLDRTVPDCPLHNGGRCLLSALFASSLMSLTHLYSNIYCPNNTPRAWVWAPIFPF